MAQDEEILALVTPDDPEMKAAQRRQRQQTGRGFNPTYGPAVGPGMNLETAAQTARGGEMNDNLPDVESDTERTILSAMIQNTAVGRSWWQRNFDLAAADVEFCYGDQWTEAVRKMRGEKAVELTMNMLPQHVQHVTGSARQAKFGIHIAQSGGARLTPTPLADTASGQVYTQAEIFEGLIRDIEAQCNAHTLYCDALQQAVESGLGWLRIFTRQDPKDAFRQQIRIKHILDRWACVVDPFSDQSDFSDIRWGTVSNRMSTAAFQAEFGKDAMLVSPGDPGADDYSPNLNEEMGWWGSNGQIRVAEYFWKEPEERTQLELIHPETRQRLVVWLDEYRKIAREVAMLGLKAGRRVKVQTYRTKWVMATYKEILAGPDYWPGEQIPLIPVLGRQVHLKDNRLLLSLIRHSHDPQRMVNYWSSKLTERIDIVPIAPYLISDEQIQGYEDEWENATTDRAFYLRYKAGQDNKQGPPKREQPPQAPIAEMTALQAARAFIHDTTGLHEPSLGKKSNETSGRAIQLRQEESDIGAFDFIDSLKTSLYNVGNIILDIIPKVYTDDQEAHIILANGSGAWVHLNHEIPVDVPSPRNPQKVVQKKVRINNLIMGRYSCRVDVGPSFLTMRREFVALMESLSQSDPQGFSAFRDLLFEAIDAPNKSELVRRSKLLMDPRMLSPEEQQNIPPPQPTPEQQVEMAKAEAEGMRAQADREIARFRMESSYTDHTRKQLDLLIKEMELEEKAAETGGETSGILERPETQQLLRQLVAGILAETGMGRRQR